MDLTFQPSKLNYLNCILQTTLSQEETSELIVPDSLPDILTIVDSFADAMLRQKECRNGSVILSGGIKGGIIYLPEDHSAARNLDFYFPFTIKFEDNALNEHSHVLSSIKIRSVDGQTINSRKAILRVNLEIALSAYDTAAETLYNMVDQPDCIEAKHTSYKLQIPLEYAEKDLSVSDFLDPALGQPPISQICKVHNDITLQEQKLIGNKAVFKGIISCKILYLGEDLHYYVCRKSLTFSQYCELQQEYDSETMECFPVITSCDWNLKNAEVGNKVDISIHFLAQILISGTKEWEITEDAFCLQGQLSPQWTPYAFNVCLDRQNFHQVVSQAIAEPCKTLLDVDAYIGFPSYTYCHDTIHMTAPIQIHLLGYMPDDTLAGASQKTEWTKDLTLTSNCTVLSNACISNPIDFQPVADGHIISFDLSITSSFFALQTITSLTGGTIEPLEEISSEHPSIILRKFEEGTALWHVARQYNARMESIKSINHIEAEILPHSQLLLIPIS